MKICSLLIYLTSQLKHDIYKIKCFKLMCSRSFISHQHQHSIVVFLECAENCVVCALAEHIIDIYFILHVNRFLCSSSPPLRHPLARIKFVSFSVRWLCLQTNGCGSDAVMVWMTKTILFARFCTRFRAESFWGCANIRNSTATLCPHKAARQG